MTASSPPSDANEDQLAAIDQMHRQFTANGIEYWLFGGWAVDFHAGRVTRAHADIDLAVWRGDLDRIAVLLESEQWRRTPDDEDGVVTYRRGVACAEVAFLARDERGTIYTPLEDGRGEWPSGSFGDELALLEGVQARVIGLAALIEEKSAGYGDGKTKAKDRIDVAVLSRRDTHDADEPDGN
jgi:hypothetical protein